MTAVYDAQLQAVRKVGLQLPPFDRRVLERITPNTAFPSAPDLAASLGVVVAQVQASLDRLAARGFAGFSECPPKGERRWGVLPAGFDLVTGSAPEPAQLALEVGS